MEYTGKWATSEEQTPTCEKRVNIPQKQKVNQNSNTLTMRPMKTGANDNAHSFMGNVVCEFSPKSIESRRSP